MHREFPGLYFDPERNRYFPISSRPKTSSPSATRRTEPNSPLLNSQIDSDDDSSTTERRRKRKRPNTLNVWAASNRLRVEPSYARRQEIVHTLNSSQVASTSSVTSTSLPENITAFGITTSPSSFPQHIVGDSMGGLYHGTTFEEELDFHHEHLVWHLDLNLTSEITAICIDGSCCVATSYGPVSKILVQNLSSIQAFIINPATTLIRDIWTANLRNRSLALGVRKKAVYLADLEAAPGFVSLDTQSDVFAVHQQQNLVFAGARNGSITRFDTRIPGHDSHSDLLNNRYKDKRSSITALDIINEWQLVVCGINGDLEMFDTRFSGKGTPIMNFVGHVNSYTSKLGFALDTENDLLFAAGQDGRIRAWSLRTGDPLHPPSDPSIITAGDGSNTNIIINNPFTAIFDRPVRTLQVVHEREGTSLWGSSGKHLYRYHLGQRMASNPI